MALSNTSSLFSSASAEALRAAYAAQLRAQGDAVANALPAQVGSPLAGSTITARYQFRVGDDGQLIPLETTISTEAAKVGSATDKPQQGTQRRGHNPRDAARDQQSRFSDFLPVKAQLAPAAEALLFAASVAPAAAQPSQPIIQRTSILAEEDGQPIEAELIAPGDEGDDRPLTASLADRARNAATGLYARNNDIIYNVDPVARLAA